VAKLTISDASRVAGVARSTLHRAIRAGRLSVDPDGHVDTAELLRAGYTLQRSTPQHAGGALQDATPRSSEALRASVPQEPQALSTVHQERDLLRLERDLLRRELEAAQAREQAALEREKDAREREALLLRMVEQVQQQNQRLLDMPRSASGPAAPGPGVPAAPAGDRGDMRRRIVALLREHPEGLSPVQTRHLLGLAKDLGSTMKAMARDGLLRRVETGWYVAREA
jgi:hypothetical protein